MYICKEFKKLHQDIYPHADFSKDKEKSAIIPWQVYFVVSVHKTAVDFLTRTNFHDPVDNTNWNPFRTALAYLNHFPCKIMSVISYCNYGVVPVS